ncbi:MAG: thioredoxin family protein [Pseudomonadota bacterium]
MSSSLPACVNPPLGLDVVCLCAQWCGTCGDYQDTFKALQQAMPGHRYQWIDIEDEADRVGDIDIETFPTLLVAYQGQVLFAGPVFPRLADAQRLLEAQIERVQTGAALAWSGTGLPLDQVAAWRALAQTLSS